MKENIYKIGLTSYRDVYRRSAQIGTSPVTQDLVNGVVDGVLDHVISFIKGSNIDPESPITTDEFKELMIQDIENMRKL